MKSKAAVVLVTLLLAITQAVYGDHPPPLGDHEVEDEASRVRTAMEAAEIVPDVVGQAPRHLIKITYPSGVEVNLGNELTPTQVKDQPNVEWVSDSDKYYTLVMTDPDAPSRVEPTYREFKHWVVVNIPGNNLKEGDTLAEFIGSGPPMGTGLHRYVFLVYEQPRKLPFTGEPRTTKTSRENRPKFSVKQFALRNNLGEPLAGNYYQAQYDDYVPFVHQQLSGQ